MPEGRVLNTGTGGTVTLTQEYIITDSQGNARLSFQNNGANKIAVKQENSYYPTGLVMLNSPVGPPAIPNKLLYNGGAEWQNDFANNPDFYQTFYRNYDAAVGRFIGVDPSAESAESMTSYQYAGNNPVMFNDPLGNIVVNGPNSKYWQGPNPQPIGSTTSSVSYVGPGGSGMGNDPAGLDIPDDGFNSWTSGMYNDLTGVGSGVIVNMDFTNGNVTGNGISQTDQTGLQNSLQNGDAGKVFKSINVSGGNISIKYWNNSYSASASGVSIISTSHTINFSTDDNQGGSERLIGHYNNNLIARRPEWFGNLYLGKGAFVGNVSDVRFIVAERENEDGVIENKSFPVSIGDIIFTIPNLGRATNSYTASDIFVSAYNRAVIATEIEMEGWTIGAINPVNARNAFLGNLQIQISNPFFGGALGSLIGAPAIGTNIPWTTANYSH
jgi:RHS repeat-associated protein